MNTTKKFKKHDEIKVHEDQVIPFNLVLYPWIESDIKIEYELSFKSNCMGSEHTKNVHIRISIGTYLNNKYGSK